MDSLTSQEIKGIWDRTKRYLNVSSLKSDDVEELAREIERQLQSTPEIKKQGSIQTLLDKGFAQRAARTGTVQQDIPAFQPIPAKKPKAKKPRKRLPPTAKRAPGGRIKIKTRKRTRTYVAKNVSFTYGKWRNKNAFWAYNTKRKRFITWGILK